ncbi:TPA: hypothetical protein ACGGRP_004439 [Escherichia coli]
MSDSIVLQLQRLSLDESISISNLLRTAYFVARKLNISDARDFLAKEINGYSEDDTIPPFRIMKGDLIAFDGKREVEINLVSRHVCEYYFCRYPIHTLEEVYAKNSDNIYIKVSDIKVLKDIQEQIKKHDDRLFSKFGLTNSVLDTFRPHHRILLRVNRLQYNHVFSIMRYFISEWSIQLEEQGYIDDNFQFSKEVMMSVNYNINTVNGIIGNINNSMVNQNNTSNFKGNDDLLRESLQQKSVSQEDIDEISQLLKQSEPPKDKDNLPPKIDEWVKKMIKKSLDGSWEISATTAGSVLAQIICSYFGIV